MRDRKLHALGRRVAAGTGLFVLALVPRALGLNAFVTPDERRWLERSVKFLAALLYQDWAGTLRKGHPGVTTMWTAVAGLTSKYLWGAWSEGVSVSQASLLKFLQGVPTDMVGPNYLVVIRFPTALVTSAFVVILYFLVGKLLGRKVALLSAILVALDPFYLAHSRLLHHDALVATFMTLSLLSFLVYSQQYRSSAYLIMSGLSAGLAFLSKATSLFLVPFIGLLAWMAYVAQGGSLFAPQSRRQEVRRWLGRLLVWGLIAGLTFVTLWPAMWVEPAKALGKVWEKSTSAAATDVHAQGGFFLGRPTLDAKILFYPVTLLFLTTPLSLAGTAMAVYFMVRQSPDLAAQTEKRWWGYFEQDSLDLKDRVRNRHLISLLLYMFLFAVFMSLGGIKYDRYLLPIYPALEILAAEGLCQMVQWAKFKELGWISHPFGFRLEGPQILSTVVLALQAGFTLPHYPYFLTYYNPALGGGWSAPRVMLVGWGEGLDQAAWYFNLREDAADLRVTSELGDGFAPFFVGETRPWREKSDSDIMPWHTTDYAVLYIAELKTDTPNEATVRYFRSLEPQHTVRLKGIEYAWIYETPEDIPDEVVPAQQVRRVQFGDSILFLGYDLNLSNVTADEIRVNLYWQCLRVMKKSYLIYLKLVNNVYHVWGQVDGIPLGGQLPTNRWQESTVVRDPWEVKILPGTPGGVYHVEVILYDAENQQALEPTEGGQLLLGPLEIPRRGPPPANSLDIEHLVGASLGDKVHLLGYNVESGFRPGDKIHLTLFWQCLGKMRRDYTAFTHLIDEKGHIMAQKDNPPVDGFYPTTKWELGEIVRDQYDLVISPEAPPGQYQLEIGMYLAETGERLKVLDGSFETDRLVLNKVEIRP